MSCSILRWMRWICFPKFNTFTANLCNDFAVIFLNSQRQIPLVLLNIGQNFSSRQIYFRFDENKKKIVLSNEGALLQLCDPSKCFFKDFTANSSNYNFCCANFLSDNSGISHVPLIVSVKTLADTSGMVLQFDFDHSWGDVNSCFVVIADFCSQVRNCVFHIEEVSMCFLNLNLWHQIT